MSAISRRAFLRHAALGSLAVTMLGGCGAGAAQPTPPVIGQQPEPDAGAQFVVARSGKARKPADAAQADVGALVDGNSAFALALHAALSTQEGNQFFSPYSISQAMAMTYAGARAATERQMAQALHFTLPQAQLHPAFNALDLQLVPPADAATSAAEHAEARFTLSTANALWGQSGYSFTPAFLDLLAENYGAGLQLLDFKQAPEAARGAINAWVASQTANKINDLLPQGSIANSTRLVLTNAIYFKATWQQQFDGANTHEGAFTLLDGGQIQAQMMSQTSGFAYAEGSDYQAIELPYASDEATSRAAMLVLLPAQGQLQGFERALDVERLKAIVGQLASTDVALTMPKFTFAPPSVSLKAILSGMGMPDAFAEDSADFSGIDGTRTLFISDVFHKAFVAVNEKGTEAAAATGAVMQTTSAVLTGATMVVNRPFIFIIRDVNSGSILFMGRVLNPGG
jgi:serpin B